MISKRKERVNVRLPSDLMRWARMCAQQRGVTLTALVEMGLLVLQERDKAVLKKGVRNGEAASFYRG